VIGLIPRSVALLSAVVTGTGGWSPVRYRRGRPEPRKRRDHRPV